MPCITKIVSQSGQDVKKAFCVRSVEPALTLLKRSSTSDKKLPTAMAIFIAVIACVGIIIFITAYILITKRDSSVSKPKTKPVELKTFTLSCTTPIERPLRSHCGFSSISSVTDLERPKSSSLPRSSRSTQKSSGKFSFSGFRLSRHGPAGRSIRDRRGTKELSVRTDIEKWPTLPSAPSIPPPAYRSKPTTIFPGVRYGMGQVGKDGQVHRPVSIAQNLTD